MTAPRTAATAGEPTEEHTTAATAPRTVAAARELARHGTTAIRARTAPVATEEPTGPGVTSPAVVLEGSAASAAGVPTGQGATSAAVVLEGGAASAAETGPGAEAPPWSGAPIVVLGIGADGWDGLGAAARAAIGECEVVFGAPRQLDLLPPGTAERVRWPSPLLPALPALFAEHAERRIGVLASGDPMFYGIGATLARRFGAQALRVFPQPSSASLACARLGWPLAEIPVVSVVAR
ncbi:precorrin-6y C5,15-methyltransferase (decarboxylating) subunit CbiE, partial [Nocardia neocaledoniensis]|uniref:precorrin-6y C5,15-methyltransferase (decarboxylating) subunit CbiE n=1 Tax=Nocardia neocaledoniensis TaxID=236511 RepID=UPI0024540873